MNNKLFRQNPTKKLISLLIILGFLILSVNQITAEPIILEEQSCYGFIVSPIKSENITIQDQINSKIRHMINDLIREEISVFWTATDIITSVKEINQEDQNEIFFEKGSFIIPFSGDEFQDIKITAIVVNYNLSSEIENDNSLRIPVYLIMEQINIQAYPLTEVKLAQHKNPVSVGEICFLEISRECGFLCFELLTDNIIAKKLNNEDFNVLTHAGAASEYATFFKSSALYTIFATIRYREAAAVRKFVSNGGGYIGSCYGANMAGSGYKFGPLTINFKRAVKNPKLPTIGVYAISDFISINPPGSLGKIQVKIVNDTHPISYFLDPITWDLHYGGSEIARVGENVEIIGQFHNTGTRLDGTPSWVTSEFGEGKTVSFSPHPEIMGFYKTNITHIGKTIVSNALFYTTAKEITDIKLENIRPLSFIEDVFNETGNTQIRINSVEVFDEIENSVNNTIVKITNLSNYVQDLYDIIIEIADEKNIDLEEKETFLGIKSLGISMMYFNHFIKYLEYTLETLDNLEKIYPFLEYDLDFSKEIVALKADISIRIADMQNICDQGYEMCENYEKALLKYQQQPLLSRIKGLSITDRGHKFYWHIYSIFSLVPQVHFNSLKLLRTSWYDYEASLINA